MRRAYCRALLGVLSHRGRGLHVDAEFGRHAIESEDPAGLCGHGPVSELFDGTVEAEPDDLTGLQDRPRLVDVDDAGQPVFPGLDRGVAQPAADLGDQSTGRREHRRPGRIREACDEDFSGFE